MLKHTNSYALNEAAYPQLDFFTAAMGKGKEARRSFARLGQPQSTAVFEGPLLCAEGACTRCLGLAWRSHEALSMSGHDVDDVGIKSSHVLMKPCTQTQICLVVTFQLS